MLLKYLLEEILSSSIYHDEIDFLKTFKSLETKSVGPLNIKIEFKIILFFFK